MAHRASRTAEQKMAASQVLVLVASAGSEAQTLSVAQVILHGA